MKYFKQFILIISITICFNGCALFTFTTTALTILTTTQEVEEDHDGDLVEYIEETLEDTYDFLAEQIDE